MKKIKGEEERRNQKDLRIVKTSLYFDLQEQKAVSVYDRNGFDIRQVHPSTLTWKDFVDNIIPVTRRSSLMLIQI